MKRIFAVAVLFIVAACTRSSVAIRKDAAHRATAVNAASSDPLDAGALEATTDLDASDDAIDWNASIEAWPTKPRAEYCLEDVVNHFHRTPGFVEEAEEPASAFLSAIASACKKAEPELAEAARVAAGLGERARSLVLYRAARAHPAFNPMCNVPETDAPKLMNEIAPKLEPAVIPNHPFRYCHVRDDLSYCAFDVGTWLYLKTLIRAEGYRATPLDRPSVPDIIAQFQRREEFGGHGSPRHRCASAFGTTGAYE
ncbi:hypothetical protein BH09MYX1_BH09MYX1_40430 [soil metagenome]